MDPLITEAARSLAAGDTLAALKRVALREDAAALALRGIAMAQLGDFVRAKALLKRAARAFGQKEVLARAKCVVAEAEIALVSRDLSSSSTLLEDAQETLEAHGDHLNAAHSRNLEARRLILIGRIDDAAQKLATRNPLLLPPALKVGYELAAMGIAIRRVEAKAARAALDRASRAARLAGIAALITEVNNASLVLDEPVARVIVRGEEHSILLDEMEVHLSSAALIVDGCRNVVCHEKISISLATRPVLFALARALGEAWPFDVSRETLIAHAFRSKHVNESYRARLRVEIGRLRVAIGKLADIRATRRGFTLRPLSTDQITVLVPPIEDRHSAVLALLADGEFWSSSALAIALDTSPRNIQRALQQLAAEGKALSVGRGRTQRWIAPPAPGFPTSLLLPVSFTNG